MLSNGYTRIKAAIKGLTDTGLAAYPIIGSTSAKLVGKSIKEYLTDPKAMIGAQLKAYEILQQDAITVQADLLLEVEAMGGVLEFPDDNICHVTLYPLKESKGKLDTLCIPDPTRDGRLPGILSACSEIKKSISDCPVGGVGVGPWSIAINLRGMQQLIFDTFDDPNFVHELMKITTETAKVWGDAILSTGASLGYTEAAASCDVISPSLYQQFIKPYHIDLFSYFKEKRSSITLHICGNALPILRDMVETGPLVISLDSKVALSDAIQIIGQDTVILGNVSTDLFIRGIRKDMDDAVKECVEAAHKKSRFILCSGCEVPINAPFENIKWFMESARKYGTASSL